MSVESRILAIEKEMQKLTLDIHNTKKDSPAHWRLSSQLLLLRAEMRILMTSPEELVSCPPNTTRQDSST